VRAEAEHELGSGWSVVDVSLNKSQSAAFNRMAVREYHKVVTCVVGGVALMEAQILVKNFLGSFQIASAYLTKQSAQHIAGELDPG
jgi:hypothetical protein